MMMFDVTLITFPSKGYILALTLQSVVIVDLKFFGRNYTFAQNKQNNAVMKSFREAQKTAKYLLKKDVLC